MAKIWRIDFYADEWLAGTVGLTMEEEGLYVRACALIYSRGGPVPIDLLKRASKGDHGNRVNACLDRLVKLGKLDVSIDGVMSKRCGNELEKARKRSEKQREKGRKGGRPNGLAKAEVSASEKPLSTYQEETTSLPSAPPSLRSGGTGAAVPVDAGVEQPVDFVKLVWDRGVELLGTQSSARNLIGKLRREYGDVAVLDGIAATQAECATNPVEFLIATMRQRSANGQQRKLSPVDKLYLGFAQAAARGDC